MPTFALILASALWASNTVGNKAIVDDLAVSEISATRFAIGAAVMWLFVVATGQVRHLRGLGWRPVALGVMEPGIASLFIVWGLSLTSAVSATVLLSTQPVVMPLLGRLLLGEAVSGRVVAGALIAFIGTTLLVQGQSSHADGALAGDLLLACGVLLICLNQILARRIAQDHGRAVAVTALQLSAASLFCGLVLLLVERPEVPFAGFDAEVGLTLLYVGAIGGAGPFFLYNYALRHLPVGVVSLLLTLMAPLGALMASAYLGTPVTASDWLAIAITAFGVAFPSLADRFGRRIALARRR